MLSLLSLPTRTKGQKHMWVTHPEGHLAAFQCDSCSVTYQFEYIYHRLKHIWYSNGKERKENVLTMLESNAHFCLFWWKHKWKILFEYNFLCFPRVKEKLYFDFSYLTWFDLKLFIRRKKNISKKQFYFTHN